MTGILDSIKLISLTDKDEDKIVETLYESFKDEKGYKVLLMAHKRGYEKRLYKTMKLLVRTQLDAGAPSLGYVDKDGNLIGVALMLKNRVSVALMTHRWFRVKLTLQIGFQASFRLIQYMRHLRDCIPEENFLVVTQIGILNDYRKLGLGSRLLQEVWDMRGQVHAHGVFLYAGNLEYHKHLKKIGYQEFKAFKEGGFVDHTFLKIDPLELNHH